MNDHAPPYKEQERDLGTSTSMAKLASNKIRLDYRDRLIEALLHESRRAPQSKSSRLKRSKEKRREQLKRKKEQRKRDAKLHGMGEQHGLGLLSWASA